MAVIFVKKVDLGTCFVYFGKSDFTTSDLNQIIIINDNIT